MKWISVEEKLPEEGVPVLVFDENHPGWITASLMVYAEDPDNSENSGLVWTALDMHAVNLADKENYVWDDDYVYTHWMPLPEAPSSQ